MRKQHSGRPLTPTFDRWCRDNDAYEWPQSKRDEEFGKFLKQRDEMIAEELRPSMSAVIHPRPKEYIVRARTKEEREQGVTTEACRHDPSVTTSLQTDPRKPPQYRNLISKK